jgi:putative membrane protein
MAQTSAPSPAARAATAQKLNKTDQNFLGKAIQGDLSEVNMGKLAQEKGQSEEVKQFGKMLEQDHSAHLQKAEQTAEKLGVNAPTEPDAKSKATRDKLSTMSGAKFDKQFAKAMISDHKRDIAAYKRQSKSKGPLADFATETLPTLQEHLETAESLAGVKPSHQ